MERRATGSADVVTGGRSGRAWRAGGDLLTGHLPEFLLLARGSPLEALTEADPEPRPHVLSLPVPGVGEQDGVGPVLRAPRPVIPIQKGDVACRMGMNHEAR